MINYNVPLSTTPADVYLNDPDALSLLTSFQTNNNVLANQGMVSGLASIKPMEEKTGGQSLNQMG